MDAIPEKPTSLPSHPPQLLQWVRGLWSDVLFPGRDSGTNQHTSPTDPAVPGPLMGLWGWLVVLFLPALILYPTIGFDLLEPDESRYAEIPREMLSKGEWVVPLLDGEPYLDKPPLLYWLIMISYKIFGISPASARLVPALCLHGLVIGFWAAFRKPLGTRAAILGAILLTLAPGFTIMGRLLTIDAVLAACIGGAVMCAWQSLWENPKSPRMGWWLASAFFTGLAILAKGPIGLILVIPPVVLYRFLRAESIPWYALIVHATLALAMGIPWYALMIGRVPDFVRHFFWEHNILRFVQPFDHQRGVWFYIPVLALGLLPCSLFAWPWLKFQFGDASRSRALRGPTQSFLLLSGGWCVFFFTLSGCKLPTYILPAFAPLCMAMGPWLATLPIRKIAGTGGLWVCALLAGNHLILPMWAAWRSPLAPGEDLLALLRDPKTPIVCYPRECHSVAFALGRDDLRNFRSKEFDAFRADLFTRDRTVVLCTHRHSLEGLRQLLPPELELKPIYDLELQAPPWIPNGLRSTAVKLAGETALGLCDVAEVRRKPPAPVGKGS